MNKKTNNKEEVVLKEAATVPESVIEEKPVGEKLEVIPGDQDAVAPAEEVKEEESPLKVGYEVGVKENGEFIFQVKGSGPGLVELLGVNVYASRKIRLLYDKTQMEGEHAVAAQFNMLNQKFNKTLETLNELLNQLAAAGAPVPTPPQKPVPDSPSNNLK